MENTKIIPISSTSLNRVNHSIEILDKILLNSKNQFFGDFKGKTINILKEEIKKGSDIFIVPQFLEVKNLIITVSDSIRIYNSNQECIYKDDIISDKPIHPVICKSNLLIFHKDGLVTFLDLLNGKKKYINIKHSHFLRNVSVSPDEQHIFTAYIPGYITVWDSKTFLPTKTFYANDQNIQKILFDPTNKNHLIVCGFESQISVWDLNKLIITKQFKEHSEMVWNMAYSYKNNLIASCSFGLTLKIYDYWSQKCLLTLSFEEQIVDMTFSNDGNYLGIVLYSGIAMIYETKKFQIICSYDQQKSIELHSSVSRSIVFQNDKYVLTSSSIDGSIHKWK